MSRRTKTEFIFKIFRNITSHTTQQVNSNTDSGDYDVNEGEIVQGRGKTNPVTYRSSGKALPSEVQLPNGRGDGNHEVKRVEIDLAITNVEEFCCQT